MSQPTAPQPQPAPPGPGATAPATLPAIPFLAVRSGIGGLLMGFANLVPGISGGAMLLIVGVYAGFLNAIAEVVTFRFRLRSLVLLAFVGGGAGLAILFLAGIVRDLVIDYRWQTYSVVIGMRLAAIPLVWRLARPATPTLWVGVAIGLALTAAAASFVYFPPTQGGAVASGPGILFLAGLLGASATILPGLDGSYILMLLGQYAPILGAIDRFKEALVGGDTSAAAAEFGVLIPVGLGVALGIGGVSLLVRWCMRRFPKPTFGVLLGILLGAFIGLYPFGRHPEPALGSTVARLVVTPENQAKLREKAPPEFFRPSTSQALAGVGLIVAGVLAGLALSKLDPQDPADGPARPDLKP